MKRIIIYKWHSYNDFDIEYAFTLAGYQITYVERTALTYDRDLEFEEKIKKALSDAAYEFFFTVNYFPAISNLCHQMGIRYVSWTCDNPLISMYDESVFHSCNYIFTFDKSNYLEFKARGVKQIYHLPLAVHVKRIDELLYDENNLSKHELYENEISFVGSLYQNRSTYDKIKNSFPQELKGYLDAMIRARLVVQSNDILDEMMTPQILQMLEESYHLEKSEESFSDLALIFQTTVLGFKIAQKQRVSALLALAKKYKVTAYHKEQESKLLMVKEPGMVNYWLEMPFVFRNSKINLNFTIPNIRTGVPLRAFDILGAGGFLLSNAQPELFELFKEKEEFVCFYNQNDMMEKTRYYLEHSEERSEIARKGYEAVKKYHTYEHRIKEIEEILATQ